MRPAEPCQCSVAGGEEVGSIFRDFDLVLSNDGPLDRGVDKIAQIF